MNSLKYKLSQVYFQSFESYQVQCFLSSFRSHLFVAVRIICLLDSLGLLESLNRWWDQLGKRWDRLRQTPQIDVGSSTAISSDGQCWWVGDGSRQLMVCCSNRDLLVNDDFKIQCKYKFCMENFGWELLQEGPFEVHHRWNYNHPMASRIQDFSFLVGYAFYWIDFWKKGFVE